MRLFLTMTGEFIALVVFFALLFLAMVGAGG